MRKRSCVNVQFSEPRLRSGCTQRSTPAQTPSRRSIRGESRAVRSPLLNTPAWAGRSRGPPVNSDRGGPSNSPGRAAETSWPRASPAIACLFTPTRIRDSPVLIWAWPTASRSFFTDTTEQRWKRRVFLHGPSRVHHSDAERFIRKATGTAGSSSFGIADIFVTTIRCRNEHQLGTGNGSIGLAVVIAVVGLGLHRPFPHMAASSYSTGTSSVSK
jgi:hypothetical protein